MTDTNWTKRFQEHAASGSPEEITKALRWLQAAGEAGDREAAEWKASQPVELDWTAASVSRPLPRPVVALGSDQLVPEGEVGLLAGAGGQGKSRLAMQLAVRAAAGADDKLAPVFPNDLNGHALQVAGGAVVMVTYEDAAPWLHMRALAAARAFDGLSYSGSEPPHALAVNDPTRLSVTVIDRPLFAVPEHDRFALPGPTRHWEAVWDRVAKIEARLVIIDPAAVALATGGQGWTPDPIGAFVAALRAACHMVSRERPPAVWVVTHTTKAARNLGADAGADAVVGSVAWVDRTRSVLGLTKQKASEDCPDPPTLLAIWKANYGPSDTEWSLVCRRREWTWDLQRPDLERGDVAP